MKEHTVISQSSETGSERLEERGKESTETQQFKQKNMLNAILKKPYNCLLYSKQTLSLEDRWMAQWMGRWMAQWMGRCV